MNIYTFMMSPFESTFFKALRSATMGPARGNVLEIGIGTGASLKYYHQNQITQFIGTDIKLHPAIFKYATAKMSFTQCSVENLPFEDNTFDYITESLAFCTVVNAEKSLLEVMRVLKPGGRFAFIEHVRPADKKWALAFDKINPLWRKAARGCNINRNTLANIKRAGFRILWQKSAAKGIFIYGVGEKPIK